MHYRFISVFRWGILLALCAGMIFQPQSSAYAAATITITPNAWNVIGLDSNNPAVGPYRFPVGAKVCSSVATTNVVVNFVWDDATNASDIFLRAGSLASITIPSIAAGAANCKDAYFEVEVNRATSPYDKTRKYHITATDSSGTVSTPQPRELYVEHLISQNRNSITNVKLNGVSIAAGGTMTLLVGNTYTIELDGGTATQGYNQFEDFINFPNTIFQMLSVSTTYSADSNTSHVPNPNPALYADACTWDNNPGSPTYRSCIGGDDKAGGSNVVTTYTVKILSGAGTTQTLNTLLYDFSGSSYHYNADYGVGARFAYIIGPSNVTMQKSFSPKAIAPGGTSALTIKLSNPTSVGFTGIHFTDTFPASMTIANTTTTNTCGGSLTDNTSGALGVGDVGIALSGGSLSANSTCTITVNVTTPAGTYVNTTGNLFVNVGGTDTDTGNNASDTLTASAAPACTPGQTIAQWTVPSTATNPPDTAGGVPTTTGGNVSSATASFTSSNGGASVIDNSGGQNDSYSWKSSGWKSVGSQILFKVDTSGYSGDTVSFYAYHDSAGPNSITVEYSTNNGTSYSGTTTSALNAAFGTQYTLSIPQNNTVWVKITATGANNDNSGADLFIDNIAFTGCGIPAPAPTIAKTFRNSAGTADVTSIQKSATSILRFTLNNTAAGNRALTGVAFTDTLPLGLDVVNSTSAQCGGTLTVTNNASPTRDTISLSGGTLAAGGSCTFDVTVTGTTEGQYDNVTGYVSSTESGISTNYAEDTLNVIAPPTLLKSFNPSSISTGNSSTLSFTITNPNNFTSLTGIGFTDTLPAGVTATNGTTNNVCGLGSSLVISGGNLLTITGGLLASNGSCSFSTNITGTTSGTKINTTSVVTSTEGGNGAAASATLVVTDLTPLIGLNKQISTDNTNWLKFVGLIPTQNIWYKFTVSNDGEATLNGINLTDSKYSLATCTPALPASLAVGASASCVLGPLSVTTAPTPNPFINTATVTTTTYTPSTPVTSTATYGTESLSLVKSVTESSFISQGNLLHYSYQVTNNGGYPLLGPVTVTDNKATVTCPVVSTVGDNDDYLDPGESLTCTATYTVAAGDVTAGSVTNTASATAGGVTSNTASKTVNRLPDFTVSKTNDVSNSVGQNATFNWTIAVSNISTGPGTFADTQTILSDTLPGVLGYYPQGALTVTNGSTAPTGTINCSITGTALSCVASGAVVFPASASFSVTFAVTPTAIGSLANTATVDPSGNVAELDETNNASTNTVTVVAAPSISKSFSPNPTVANVNSTLTFTITNPNTTTALNGVAFSDTYPTGLVNATPLSTTNSCGGSLTATAAGGTISLSGGTIATNSSCTITVAVVAATGGTYVNTTGNVTSTNGGAGNTASSTLDVFDAQPSKSLVTTSEPSTSFSGAERVTIGEMVRYRLVSRVPEGSFTNVQLLDGIPTGLQFLNDNTAKVAFICNSGAACMTSSTLSGAGLVVNGTSSNVSPTFTVPGAAISGGPFASGTDVTFNLGNIANLDTDANVDSEYIVVEFNALVLNVNSGVTINQGTDNQDGSDIANNRQNDVTLRVNGSAVGTASPNVTVDIAEPAITSFTKSVSPAAGPYLPGDALVYTLSFSNTTLGHNNAATAFDIVLSDTFDSNLSLGTINVSSTQAATCAGGSAFTTGNSTVAQLLTVNVSCLDPGKSVTVTVNTTISAAASSGTNIANSSSLTYTSLPGTQGNCATSPFTCSGVGASGSGTGERNGSGGSGADGTILNNYAFTSNTVTTPVTYGSITIILDSVPNNAQDFSFTGSGPGGYTFGGGFSLDDDADGTLPNTRTFTSLVPGTYTLTQGIISGWTLTGLTCVDPDSGSAVDLGTATATIDLDAGENVICTFTNTQWAPAIVLTKTPTLDNTVVAPNTVSNPGDTITYAFSVQNTGNVTVTNINITDPLLPSLSCTIASLAAGATSSCTPANNVYILTQTDVDAGTRANTATAIGKDPGNNDVTDSDSINTPLTLSVSIVLTKTPVLNDAVVLPGGVVNPGDTITYSFSVQNTGNVTITNINVTDPLLPTLSCTIASLAPGATSGCTATNNVYTLTQADIDAGSRANTATATGKDPGNNDVSDPDTKTTTLPQSASIVLTKTPTLDDTVVAPSGTVNAGDTIIYTFSVQNTGNVTITNINVADPLLPTLSCVIASLVPGATASCTPANNVYTLTQADINAGSRANTATSTGKDPNNNDVADPDTRTVTLTQSAALTIAKSATEPSYASVGDVLHYSYVLTNSGNVTLDGPFTVTDDQSTDENCPAAATLAPGANLTCNATYAVTQADLDSGSVTNVASAHGSFGGNPVDSATDTVTVNATQTPALSIVKSVTEASYATVGDVLHYSYLVMNSGNVTLDGPFTVTDNKSTDESCPATATLNVGASITCSATYTVTQADLNAGSVTNVASAHGSFGGNPVNSGTDSVSVNAAQTPALSIVKSVTETSYSNAGDVLHYSYLVTNTGNVTLDGLFTVTDDKSTDETCPATATLAPGASLTCTATYTIGPGDMSSGSVTNVASAHGSFGGNAVDSSTDTKTVNLAVAPAIVLTKTPLLDDTVVAPSGVVNAGDTITYSFSVENTGNVPITNINVTDPLLPGLTCTIATLNLGATASCTPSNNVYTVTQADIDAGSLSNTATATGKDPGNNDVQDSDTKITTLGKAPALTIVKEVSTDNSTWNDTSVSVSVGDTVYYRVLVSNTGNTTLTGLTVDDGMASCALARGTDITGNNDNTFEAGEEWAYTCSVTAVLGTNNNTATADTNETTSVSDSASYVAGAASVADPALSKSANPTQASVGDVVTFTLTVTNKGTTPAPNVVVTDALPAIFDVTAVNISGAPPGTVVNVTPLIGTGSAPYTVVVTLGGDLTATDVVTIQIITRVNSAGNPPINNSASLTTSALTDIVSNDSASVAINIRRSVHRLPATGFAKGIKTILGPQPLDLKFAATDVMLEIPSLGVKIPIVGVPQKDGTWNISWLENQAGWLQGTAFPSWSGNSVLTGHVYMASGLPGPFVNLNKLKYGDKIIIHAYGQKYTFAVQTNTIVSPDDQSVMKHEEKSWVTLVTCKDYDEKTRTYLARVVVRAVLVEVDWE